MKRAIYPLYAAADENKVRPILDALQKEGATVRDGGATPGREDALLLFLSKSVAADGPEADAFFRLNAGRALVIPVNLDGAAPPEALQNALMARHTLDGAKYGPQELAERIARAARGEGKNRLPLILSAAAAVILLVVGGIILSRQRGAEETAADVQETAAPTPTAEPALPQDVDLSREELEKVFELVIVGDSFNYFTGEEEWMKGSGNARVGVDYVANRSFENGQARWYSAQDGHELALYDWGDMSFLSYMKNLTLLTLVNVQGTLPDLSGLKKLNCVELLDCAVDDLSGLRGTNLINFGYDGPVVDFSPLNDCRQLVSVNLSIYGSADMDMAAFAPPALTNLRLGGQGNERSIDLAGLKQCRKLERVEFWRLPLTDLDFLSGTTVLGALNLFDLPRLTSLDGLKNVNRALLGNVIIDNCSALRDLSALSLCIGLDELNIQDCPIADLSCLTGAKALRTLSLQSMSTLRSFKGLEDHRNLQQIWVVDLQNLTDISALESCANLESLNMNAVFSLADISPALQLPKLRDLQIYGSRLNDVDFLWDIQNKEYFSFGIAEVPNWEGLAAIEKYSYLNITDRDGSALPYVQNATVTDLEVWNRGGRGNESEGFDLTRLPQVTNELKLHCVTSLEGLDQPNLRRLHLDDCPNLTSLSGLEQLPRLTYLGIWDCPRLNDWSALNGRRLDEIYLEALFSLPDFGQISVRDVSLTTIYDLKDLSCFAEYKHEGYRITLMDVDGVTDLSPLYHLHGSKLYIPAHLRDQAQALVDSGLLDGYEVMYPEGWWQPIEPDIQLTSIDEIDTLPSALLSRIRSLTLAGDAIVPDENAHVEEDWSTDPPTLYIRYDGEEDRVPVEPGTLTDLGCLEKLTGLEGLTVYAQPQLTSLAGMENMDKLKRLNVIQCPALTDGSAAFTVQSLEELRFQYTGVTSLQGIQNLYALRMLDLNENPVADLSPLGACGVLERATFELPMMPFDEFAALPEGVRQHIHNLTIAGEYVYDGGPWWFDPDWVTDPPRLYLHSNETDERLALLNGVVTDMEALAALLPNLENLNLYAQQLTSLDGIEAFQTLRRITVEECRQLTDYAALWNVPSLEDISLRNQPIESIEGVENLPHLTNLSLSGANVTDFSPLARVDYSYCTSEEYNGRGFNLALDVWDADQFPYEAYAVLEAVPVYWGLNMNNVPVDRWLDHVMEKEMYDLSCHRSGISNEQFRAFVEKHPGLEKLDLRWNPQLTDLSCLLGLGRLRDVFVSPDMEAAIASLGEGYGFDLRIEN